MHLSPDHPLMAFVGAADAQLAAGGGAAILRVSELGPPAERFARFPLDGQHPLDVLLGFVAPLHWRALGVSCTGTAHPLDATGRRRRGGAPAAGEPAAVGVTVLLDRSGGAAGLMRRGATATALPGRPEGAVADACRRALGLPTSPPPASTLDLWTLAWLDRVVEAASQAEGGSGLRSWSSLAALHAAAGPPGEVAARAPDPASLAAAARDLAAAWTWARLRADPAVVDLPGPPPSPRLAAWMDDGMWARWLLSLLPAADDLMSAVHALLPPALAEAVALVARAAWR